MLPPSSLFPPPSYPPNLPPPTSHLFRPRLMMGQAVQPFLAPRFNSAPGNCVVWMG